MIKITKASSPRDKNFISIHFFKIGYLSKFPNLKVGGGESTTDRFAHSYLLLKENICQTFKSLLATEELQHSQALCNISQLFLQTQLLSILTFESRQVCPFKQRLSGTLFAEHVPFLKYCFDFLSTILFKQTRSK